MALLAAAKIYPVLARTRTLQLFYPQNLGFVVSALLQRLLVWFARAKIPARQIFPWEEMRERRKSWDC